MGKKSKARKEKLKRRNRTGVSHKNWYIVEVQPGSIIRHPFNFDIAKEAHAKKGEMERECTHIAVFTVETEKKRRVY